MDRRFGYYILVGLVIGALFGRIAVGNGNALLGLGFGALLGVFLGWFAAAIVMQQEKRQ